MKTKILILTAAVTLSSVPSSCVTRGRTVYDNSHLTTYEEKLPASFDAISVAHNIEVTYTVANNVKLTVSTPQENKDNVVAKVQDNTLILECANKKRTFNSPKVKVTLSAPAIQTIIARNNAEISISGNYNVEHLSVTATNNAEVDFKGKVTASSNCEFTATNNAEIDIAHINTRNLTTTTTNNAELSIKDIRAQTVVATATNNAEAELAGKADNASLTATNNASLDAAKLVVTSANCTAYNLAHMTTNAASITSETHNSGSVKNKR